ncbi:hypothetical protein JW868_01755 [Candidatus Woesearchaeota archaeon]|nr:hypothetical protein [Candidatus Woesearchaeota archaeon]
MPAKRKAKRRTAKRIVKKKAKRTVKKKVMKKKVTKKKAPAKRGVKETIVGVRVSPGFKRTFFATCRKKGTNPTDVLRAYMEGYAKKK